MRRPLLPAALLAIAVLASWTTGAVAHAKGGAGKGKLRVLGTYHAFSGLKLVSLGGKGATAFGLELGTERAAGTFLSLAGKLRAEMGSGQATFDDAGTERTIAFTSMHGTVGVGLKLYVAGQDIGLRPYLGGNGLLGFNQLGLTPSTSYTVLETTSAGMSLGYELTAGVAFGQDTAGIIEVQLRTVSATLNTTSLSLGGFTLVGGIEF